MPKAKRKTQLIENQLAEKCRKLIDGETKKIISQKTGYSVVYINCVISGTRYNKEIIKELKKEVKEILEQLNSDEQ